MVLVASGQRAAEFITLCWLYELYDMLRGSTTDTKMDDTRSFAGIPKPCKRWFYREMVFILLMAEILHQLRLVVYPIIYKVLCIPGG